MSRHISIDESHLLLVEGQDESGVFAELIDTLAFGSEIQIVEAGGKEKLKETLMTLDRTEGFYSIDGVGIVQDADESFDDTFDSIRNYVDTHTSLSQLEDVETFASSADVPACGALILPRENETGMLEDLLLETVSAPLLECIEEYLQCASACTDAPREHEAKSQVCSFLGYLEWREAAIFEEVRETALDELEVDSSQASAANPRATIAQAVTSKPRLDTGEAAEAGYWDFDDSAFEHVKRFLRALVSQ